MGIFIKRRQGIEYLYVLAGSSQYFLGRRDDPDNLNMQNLHKATRIVDRNFDRMFTKYIRDMQEYAQYMPKKEHARYVRDRLDKIDRMLEQASLKAK